MILVFGIGLIIFSLQKEAARKKRILSTVTLQITVPKESTRRDDQDTSNEPKDFREAIAPTDQFFSSLSSLFNRDFRRQILSDQDYLSFEIVSYKNEISFYIACPKDLMSLVEKQVNSYYPYANIERVRGHNIFAIGNGKVSASNIKLVKRFIFPIKTYRYLDSDPLNNLTNALSKMGQNASGAIQFLIKPISNNWRMAPTSAAKQVMEGKNTYMYSKWWQKALSNFWEGTSKSASRAATLPGQTMQTDSQGNQMYRHTPAQEELMKAFNEKAAKPGFAVEARVVAVAQDEQSVKMLKNNIVSAFAQFNAPAWNSFRTSSAEQKQIILDYITRNFNKGNVLNSEEVASLWHLPNKFIQTPNIKWLQSRTLPAPTNLPEQGVVIGKSVYRGEEKLIRFKDDDRRRHLFMIGKTGVGKTTLFENMIMQDISQGKGVCFVDPLGDAIESILQKIPTHRARDVIVFDPSDTDYPLGLNLLNWEKPEEKDFLVSEWLEIFYKLFDPGRTGIVGPQFEHWGRNAALSVMSLPEGGTLIDIPRMFTDDDFRDRVIANVKDPVVLAFWQKQLVKTADFHKSEMFNYFISKFGRFMTNDLMRNIIGQARSTFNFRQVMDEGKILLINLSKGKIGEMNSNLLGMILVSKIQAGAFSRADISEENRRDFYLYVDEFQNFTTDTFATILSEARKYRLNLNITNQYIAQLTEKIRDAVIGNAGTLVVYRIGAADGEFMSKEFPGATIDDMVNLDRFKTYVKLLIDLTPSKPFSMLGIKTNYPSNPQMSEWIKQNSRALHSRAKTQVEKEIGGRGGLTAPPAPEPTEALRQT
ncbi:MAG: hypothetical protein CEN89_228 [Candidatus Berkelbacteria bacterium Licking1014_7]|uniref:Type IV secretion system coupling protein TraD DNA-binding domain-containing protein n=1 Tax=Candidatus Berkelbacteria bacterium Licking1014_7 TaxID=2017147 RepID=A0A554LK51_9BACT|nr:MAG: hypothetical protein CEN89_228 [Candidatus Berkelbacteria bacterium Licking1014_7]